MLALLVTVSAPVRVPVAVGVKVTDALHEAPAASELPQVFDCAKSPLVEMELSAVDAVPLLVIVTDWLALVVP